MADDIKIGSAYIELETRGSVKPGLDEATRQAADAAQKLRLQQQQIQGAVGATRSIVGVDSRGLAIWGTPSPAVARAAAGGFGAAAPSALSQEMREHSRRLGELTRTVRPSLMGAIQSNAGAAMAVLSGTVGGGLAALGAYRALAGANRENVALGAPWLATQSEYAERDLKAVLGRGDAPQLKQETAAARAAADRINAHIEKLRSQGKEPNWFQRLGYSADAWLSEHLPPFVSQAFGSGGAPGGSRGAAVPPGLGRSMSGDQLWRAAAQAMLEGTYGMPRGQSAGGGGQRVPAWMLQRSGRPIADDIGKTMDEFNRAGQGQLGAKLDANTRAVADNTGALGGGLPTTVGPVWG